jgi:hypothetical protein
VRGGRGGRGRGRGRGGRGPGPRQVAFIEQQQGAASENAEAVLNSNAAGNQRGGNAGACFGGCCYGGGRT